MEHASARLLAPRLPPSSRRPPLGAALVMKLGRRAPSAGAYASLRASIEATLGLEVNLVEPHKLSVRRQLEEMSRAAVAVSPDGGASFACAFLADGAAVVILGYLERWIWANDRRVRAFYCAPRDDHLPFGQYRHSTRTPCSLGSCRGAYCWRCRSTKVGATRTARRVRDQGLKPNLASWRSLHESRISFLDLANHRESRFLTPRERTEGWGSYPSAFVSALGRHEDVV